jgi:predicted secreted protein
MITERPYTGLTAEIKVNNSVLGYMSGVDLTLEKNIIEVLQFGARYQEKVPAIKNWTANVDGTAAFTSGGSQHKLYQAFENDEEITVGIFLDDKVYFEGKAFVENLNITGAPDDKMNISCDLSGNGAITFTVPEVYLVDIHSGVGGTTTPGGSQKVAKGEQVEITITPAAGYTLDKLMDNAEDKTTSVTSNKYTLTNVTADHEIVVTFKEG